MANPRNTLALRARRPTAAGGALILILTLLGSEALAQGSGLQQTPDSQRYLISKDVGAERWAISFNLRDRTVTGNVFKTDGSAPSFIWCSIENVATSPDPAATQYTLDCYGGDACAQAPCSEAAWTLIASGLVIDGSFLLPDGTKSTLSGNVQPILDRSCADSLSCHQQGGAGRLDLGPGLSWASAFLVPARQAVDPAIFYVDPFRIESSYLVSKIRGQGFGSQMPLGRPPLPPEDQQAIVDWILEGAADN
jgi:hypothetical protein